MAGGINRVSDQMRANTLLNTIRATQLRSGLVQRQLATGTRLLTPSMDPDASSQVLSLQRMMGLYEQVKENLDKVSSVFGRTDGALGTIAEQLRTAQSLASTSIAGTADDRAGIALTIQSILNTLVGIANISEGDTFLFAGTASTTPAFFGGVDGIRYDGNADARLADLGGV